jgi:hypothetical protein
LFEVQAFLLLLASISFVFLAVLKLSASALYEKRRESRKERRKGGGRMEERQGEDDG